MNLKYVEITYCQNIIYIFLFTLFVSFAACLPFNESIVTYEDNMDASDEKTVDPIDAPSNDPSDDQTDESPDNSSNGPIAIPDMVYQKLDNIIETFKGKSTEIGICSKEVEDMTHPKSCADLRLSGVTCDGTYVIYPQGLRPVTVRCDMTTDGGGWTVALRRGDYGEKSTTFCRNWKNYKNGFGHSNGEFWLGNEVLHRMTSDKNMTLKTLIMSSNNIVYVNNCTGFKVRNENSEYGIDFYSNIYRSYNTEMPFSTYDHKNKGYIQGTFCSGWWYMPMPPFSEVLTKRVKTHAYGGLYQELVMMLRPEDFTLK